MKTNAARKVNASPAPPLEVFSLRCWARARLYAAGELTLQDAVDGCQQHAEAHGLVAQLGQNAIQQIIADAFDKVRELS
jgi:hypothetical protein